MYKINTNNTTYIVPLDGIDLNSLSRSYDTGGVRPLWSVPSGEDYYEFKLNAWRISEESDNEEITGLESESQICHICNTHVPIMYIKDHNNSTRHINMKKIHNLLIIRGQNPDLNSSEEHELPKTNIYCEECSMIVPKNNIKSHEESYTHKKSLRNNDLIEQFLKFYSQDLNANKIKTPMTDYFNKFLNRKNLSFKVDVVDDDHIVIFIKEHKVKIHGNNFHGFVKMDDELICILCEIQLQVNAIEPHIESKKHRKKITRYIDDQHCIREVNDSFVHCLLCNELVLITRVAGHRLLSYHMFNLNQALGRKSRDFNKNYITSKETDSSVFGHLNDELQSDDGEIGDRSVSNDELQSNDGESNDGCESDEKISSDIAQNENIQASNQTYCSVCSIFIDTHNFKKHKMGSYHKQLESSKITVDNKTQEKVNAYIYKEIMAELGDISEKLAPLAQYAAKDEAENPGDTKNIKPVNIHYHMEESSYNIVSCRVCNLKMYIEDMNDHINHEKHITKYENLLKVNKITKKNDYLCHCQVCDDPVLVKRELDHIYSIQHRNNINNEDESDLETNINQVENINGCEIEENANIDPDTDTNDQKDDSVQIITENIQQNGSQRQTDTEVTEIPADFIEKVNYQILETTNDKDIVCKVCDIKVSNTDLDIFKHFDGDDHALKYSELLKTNRLTKAQNKFFCYACKASITSRNELEHIFGNKHKSKFPNHDIDAACKISCQINDGHISVTVQSTDMHEKVTAQTTNDIKTTDVLKTVQQSIQETKNHDDITKIENAQAVFIKQYYLVTKTKNPSEVTCKVCNIILTNSMINIESHMLGADHKNRYEKLLKSNGIKNQGNGFYCEACKVYLTNKNEMIHINGFKHQSNVLRYALSYLDSMCFSDVQLDSGKNVDQADTQTETSEKVQLPLEETKNEPEESIDQTDDIDAGTSNDNVENPENDKDNFDGDEDNVDDDENIFDDEEEIDEPSHAESEMIENSDDSDNEHPSTETINVHATFSKPYYHVTKTANPAEVLCKICNVLLSNSTINIETHIMGFNHTNKYKILIDSNGLKKENNRYFCEICNVFVSNKNEVEHIMGFKHKARLPKEGECTNIHILCEICNTNIPSFYMEKHLTSPEHFMNELMKETTAKLDVMMKKMKKLEEESNALRSRTTRLAYHRR